MLKTAVRYSNNITKFDDLRGLRAECYVRDSTLDQSDGYGPEMQRRAVQNFARSYDLSLGEAYYTDFITGTSTLKRSGFQQALTDARIDRFDVLLVYHTSRFARNRADAIRYKAELRKLGITIIFVSQGIISGNDNHFLNEGINEVIDEQYSLNISRFVTDGLFEKHRQGISNGKPPLGYKSLKEGRGNKELKVTNYEGIGGNPKLGGMDALITLLKAYSSGQYSYETLSKYLNIQGYRNRLGKPFAEGSIDHVLSNRFYEGKAVLHPGKPDEEIIDGIQEVPLEVKSLWLQCQEVKRQRAHLSAGRPRLPKRAYPFSKVTVCDSCGHPYSGQPVHTRSGQVVRRLYHSRPFCDIEPHSIRVENIVGQFSERVLPYMVIDQDTKENVKQLLKQESNPTSNHGERQKIERALNNLRKQHLWGDITDEEYKRDKQDLNRQLSTAIGVGQLDCEYDFDRIDLTLSNLRTIWNHPGVNDEQRESLVKEIFREIRLRGSVMVSVEPKPEYKPIFVNAIMEAVRNGRGERI
jgi:DNA invertase Pin-like site-specific DNA recombinase